MCDSSSLLSVLMFIKYIIKIMMIVSPILLMVVLMLKLVKFLNLSDSSLKDLLRQSLGKIILLVCLFMTSTITNLVFNIIESTTQSRFAYCWEEANLTKITDLKRIERERQNREIDIPINNNNSSQIPDANSRLEIHFIGNGYYDDAILIRDNDNVVFIDGGRYKAYKKDYAYLKDLGIKKIDVMIGSHLHDDHIAAQSYILDKYTVGKIYYPDNVLNCADRGTCRKKDQEYMVPALKKHNKTVQVLKQKDTFIVGNMQFYILGPTKLTTNINNNSFIFILKYFNNTFMFTGDSVFPNLSGNINNAKSLGINFNVDFLKYQHHGNATMSDKILDAVKPKYIVVPNYNAKQYPNEANTNRILKRNIKMYKLTDSKTGNVAVFSDGNNITIVNNAKASDYKR